MHSFPSPVDFARAIRNGSAKNLIPAAFDPQTFRCHPELLDPCKERIQKWLAEPIEILPYRDFSRFARDGNRLSYETKLFRRRARLTDLAIGVFSGDDPDGLWLHALEDILWEICNEPTWALPAHLWEARELGPDAAVSYPHDPYHPHYRTVIDLFSSEMAFCIAEILHVLGDKLSPEVVARCHAEIRERVLDSFLSPGKTQHWILMQNNWAAVCGASVFATFLYEEPHIDRCLSALWPVLAGMQSFFDSFPADGTCVEGLGYWAYGFGFFVLFADILYQFTDGALNLMDNPAVRTIAAFPARVTLSAHRGVSYSDAESYWTAPRWLLHRLHAFYPDDPVLPTAPAIRGARFATFIREFLWADPTAPGGSLPNATEFLPDAEWLIVRRAPFGFSAKFGHNDVPHNHNDIGTFLLVRNDEEGPMDLGSGEYTHEYFNQGRYDFLVCSSRGHSVPIVAGTFQRAGRDAAARDVRQETRPDGSVLFSADIAPAYALPDLTSLRRTFLLSADGTALDLQDDYAFSTPPSEPTLERFIGFVKPTLLAPGEAQFGPFRVHFDPTLSAAIHEHTFSNHSGRSTYAYTLDITLPVDTTSFHIRFE